MSKRTSIIPKELLKDIINGEVVFFIGAGVTTESGYSSPLFHTLCADLGIDPDATKFAFSEVTEKYCNQRDNAKKYRLIKRIRDHIDFYSWGEPHRWSSSVLKNLRALPQMKRIITTNWDQFIEQETHAIPIVTDEDLVYWDDRKRVVIKFHGCISQPKTMVITRDDYERLQKKLTKGKSEIGIKIRSLLSTKTFLFLGYSLSDPDFEYLWGQVNKNLGEFTRPVYLVTKNASRYRERWEKKGVHIIECHLFGFSDSLVNELVARGKAYDSSNMRYIARERERIFNIHQKTTQDTKGGFLSSMYQDGVFHSLDSLAHKIIFGAGPEAISEELAEARSNIDSYKRLFNKEKGFNHLVEVAYWFGRSLPHEWFKTGEFSRSIPAYFHPYRLQAVKFLVKGSKAEDNQN